MNLIINPHLAELPVIDYRTVEYFQGDLKTLTKENYVKLRNSLISQGLLAPLFVWVNPTTKVNYLMDGHQRKQVFTMESVEPFMIPYVMVPGKTIAEAKMNLLSITSQYGTITDNGLKNFSIDIPKIWIAETVNFDALAKPFKVEFEAKPRPLEEVTQAMFYVNVKCRDEKHCQELYDKFVAEGLDVKIVT